MQVVLAVCSLARLWDIHYVHEDTCRDVEGKKTFYANECSFLLFDPQENAHIIISFDYFDLFLRS